MDKNTHEEIFQAVGKLQGTVEAVKDEVHLIRAAQLESEKRQIHELHKVAQSHIEYGKRISVLEKKWSWVTGIAVGIALVFSILVSDMADLVKKWLGFTK